MPEEKDETVGLSLVLKILLATGIGGLVVGAFLLVFVTIPVGLVLLAVGVSDLVAFFVLPKISGAQQ